MKIDYDKIAENIPIKEADKAILAFGMIPKTLADMLEKQFKIVLINKHLRAIGLDELTDEEAEEALKILPIKKDIIRDFNHNITVALMKKYTMRR